MDRRPHLPPIRDQGSYGACVGLSGTALLSELPEFHGKRFSPMFLYKEAQKRDEWEGESYSGTSIEGALRVMINMGVCEEALYPYDKTETSPMHATAPTNALMYRISHWDSYAPTQFNLIHNVLQTRSLWTSLRIGDPFRYSEFDTPHTFLHDKGNWTQNEQGHAVLIVGYCEIEGVPCWICRNSWGIHWGDKGYFYISKTLFAKYCNSRVYAIRGRNESENEKKPTRKKNNMIMIGIAIGVAVIVGGIALWSM